MSEVAEVTKAEAAEIVRRFRLRGLPLSTLDETYYYEGPEQPSAADVFGDKLDKRPWIICHRWEGYGPARYLVNSPALDALTAKSPPLP